MELTKFEVDNWIKVDPFSLKEGDLINQGSTTAIVTGKVHKQEGKTVIPATEYEPGPITLQIGEPGRQYMTMAMDFVNCGVQRFDDGTGLITEFEHGNTFVFSPRLPMDELEAFCERHIEVYQNFFDKHYSLLDEGEIIEMKPFW